MKVVGLVSGGKDSCFNLMKCMEKGHEIVCLGNLHPPSGIGEMDSYMYQSVGHDAMDVYGEAIGLPLYRATITGQPLSTGKEYTLDAEDEVEDLHKLLRQIKSSEKIEAVSVGAIYSNYQKVRVEHVDEKRIVIHSDDAFAPVGYLKLDKVHLEAKSLH